MPSPKPENRFIGKVHKDIPRVYSEKMNNPYRAGTPDVYYSGTLGDLWVEYKYLEKLPRKGIIPDLTDRQRRWLNNRHDEGRNVAVILGTPNGCVIYRNKDWDTPLSVDQFQGMMVSVKDASQWILSQVGESKWLYTERL